jgi:hypothetical protein
MAKTAVSFRNSHLQAIADALDNGYCRIYTVGSGVPATADTAITDQTLLAELRFAATAETSVTAGVLTFAAMTPDDGLADGTPAFARCLSSNGTTAVVDLTASGTGGGGELELSTASVITGATLTYPAS